jgi:hypothetical protein
MYDQRVGLLTPFYHSDEYAVSDGRVSYPYEDNTIGFQKSQ